MSMLGADVFALFGVAAELLGRKRKLRSTIRRMGRLVEAADWVGPDREAFLDAWRGQHLPHLMHVIEELDGAASEVRRHAERQQETSCEC